ncbi:hypothetical protein B0J17DRAFT_718562 [Rhizoctonia solani]|nr:hypothetical protein B0J17DRAFT_718562 [Rhizoctonia solani]
MPPNFVSEPTISVNNTLEDFANGAVTNFSLEVGLIVIRALVNTVTLMISTEIGIHAPFAGYRVLSSAHGNLKDGVKAEVNSPMARGCVNFYLECKELWVQLDLLGPLFPITNGALKVIDLDSVNSSLQEVRVKRELEG